MTTNKDDFKTTYSKVKGFHIIGYNADTDEYSKLHVDENGHIFAKLIGDAGATNVAIAVDTDGTLYTYSKTQDGAGNPITATVAGPKLGLDVNVVSGSLSATVTGVVNIQEAGTGNDLTISADGEASVNVNHIQGDMGKVRISPMGALKTASTIRVVGQSFTGGTVDPAFWTLTGVGTGAVTQNYGEATLTTAATANSSALVNSVKLGRYIAGIASYFRGNIRCPAVTTTTAGYANKRRWGAFDADNGFFFLASQTNPATSPTLSVVCRKTDGTGLTDTAVASGSFNGNVGTTYTLDTNLHTYEIWYSNKNIYFYVDDVLLHTVTSLTTPAVGTLSLKVGLQTINSGDNTGVNTLVARSAMINRLGVLATMPTYKNITGAAATTVIKYTAGYLHKIIFNNTTGTSVALWDGLTGAAPSIAMGKITTATAALGVWDFGVPFFTGLTIVTVGDNLDCTVVFE